MALKQLYRGSDSICSAEELDPHVPGHRDSSRNPAGNIEVPALGHHGLVLRRIIDRERRSGRRADEQQELER